MLEGVRAIGEALLLEGKPFLVHLLREVSQGSRPKVVYLDLGLDPLCLRPDSRDLDEATLAEILWVGNASSTNPQDRLTTDNLEYLVSQTIPSLLRAGALPSGDLRTKLEKVQSALFFDLGVGSGSQARYRFLWDPDRLEPINGLITRKELEDKAKKGSPKEAVQLLAQKVRDWILKELGLGPKEAALYTLRLEGELLAGHREYAEYLEKRLVDEVFQSAPKGVCHACGKKGEVTADTTRFRLLKFYITDKPGFASGLGEEGFWRNYALCQGCYRALLVGERFVESELATPLGRGRAYVVPEFHDPSLRPQAAELEDWARYLKKRVAAAQTLEGWQEFQEALEDYQEFEQAKASFTLHFLLVTRSKSAVKVDRLIREVPPSRLDRLDEVRNRVRDWARGYLGEDPRGDWDLALGRMPCLLPRKEGQDRPFLEFLDALLTGRPLGVDWLIRLFLENARAYRFGDPGECLQGPSPKDRLARDRALTLFLLRSQLLLRYLGELGQLGGFAKGGRIMYARDDLLDQELREYLEALGLGGGKRGLFLLGYLLGQIGATREQRESGKPILNKVHFQGMDRGKVMRLANEAFEKLRQYRIARYNEGVYAAMKEALDMGLGELNAPQENTYWILSGYAYATWRAIQGSREG